MFTEAIVKAVLADPDGRPLTEAILKRMKRRPGVKIIRRALLLTQEHFAERSRAYLALIGRDPERANRMLNTRRARSTAPKSRRLYNRHRP
jgi:hypothetical protein